MNDCLGTTAPGRVLPLGGHINHSYQQQPGRYTNLLESLPSVTCKGIKNLATLLSEGVNLATNPSTMSEGVN